MADKPDKKVGAGHLWRVFMRESPALLGAGALAMGGALVFGLGLMIGVNSHSILPMAIGCTLGGLVAAPEICGVADTILRAVRGDPDAWWVTYRRAWKRNAKGSLVPGAAAGLVYGMQAFIFAQADRIRLDLLLLALLALGSLVAFALTAWLVPQLVMMELPTHRVLLNAALLCVRHPLRTLGAALVQLAYWGCFLLAYPFSLIVFLLLNFWFPMLLVTGFVYDPLNEAFGYEKALAEQRAQRERKV